MSARRDALGLLMMVAPLAASIPVGAAEPVTVPLREGLTIVDTYSNTHGDFETIITVRGATASDVTLTASADESADTCSGSPDSGTPRSWGTRVLRREDLENALAFRQEWSACPASPQIDPGMTAIGVSARVLRELLGRGEVELTADTSRAGMVRGTLTRVSRDRVPITVVVNDHATALPSVQARWHSAVGDRDYWILADAANPLVLRAAYMGKPYFQIVKITFPTDEPVAVRVERDLAKTGRTVLHGIYFNSGSDRLREESKPALADVVQVLQQHPGWSIAIEGHTDNIGTDANNLDLSKRRAAAVRNALVATGVSSSRLGLAGFGSSRPEDTNDTAEGRARNRRVELVRQ